MANIFAKAAAKPTVAASAKKTKETSWRVGEGAEQAQLSRAITELREIQGQAKALEARAALPKGLLKAFAEQNFIREFAAQGVQPEAPMKIINERGESVTFVVQDRATGFKVSDETLEGLNDCLGADQAAGIVFEQTMFGFDPAVMAQPTAGDNSILVQDLVGEELGKLLERLLRSGKLSESQAEGLVTAEQKRTFRPGLVPRLADICGRSVPVIREFLEVIGAACVRYIKTN